MLRQSFTLAPVNEVLNPLCKLQLLLSFKTHNTSNAKFKKPLEKEGLLFQFEEGTSFLSMLSLIRCFHFPYPRGYDSSYILLYSRKDDRRVDTFPRGHMYGIQYTYTCTYTCAYLHEASLVEVWLQEGRSASSFATTFFLENPALLL